MSFLTTRPEALIAAAGALQALGSSMAAQNAAAAAPTTGVAPAAADEVSALQATLFSAYGTWYQNVGAQATAIHQALVNTLGTNAGSYGDTEAANQVTTSAQALPGILSGLDSSSGATIGTPLGWGQNFGAAASDLVQIAPSQTPAEEGPGATGLTAGVAGGLPAPPSGPAGFGSAPLLAVSGAAPSVGGLSVPPSWAAVGAGSAGPTPATLTGAGWTGPAPEAARVTAVPAGMPAVASANRGGLGLGAPRYGAKPIVMPKPTVT